MLCPWLPERGGRQPPGRRQAAGSRSNLLSPTTCRLTLNGRHRLVKGLGPVRRQRTDTAVNDQDGVGRAAEEPCSPPYWVGRRRPSRTPKRSTIRPAKRSAMSGKDDDAKRHKLVGRARPGGSRGCEMGWGWGGEEWQWQQVVGGRKERQVAGHGGWRSSALCGR